MMTFINKQNHYQKEQAFFPDFEYTCLVPSFK